MKDWSRWGWTYWSSLMRHIGTAGMTWLGTSAVTGGVTWKTFETLPIALIVGAVLPTTFTFFQNTPTPDDLPSPEDPGAKPK